MAFDFLRVNTSHNMANKSDLCKPVSVYPTLAFLAVPIVQIFINIIVIHAAIKNRRKLRHNYVYIYVISTLSANALFGILASLQLTNLVFNFERLWGEANPFSLDSSSTVAKMLKGWWVFRTGYMITLFIIMSASVCALIFGIRESSYFVGRSTCHVPERKSFGKASPKRRKTVISIVVSTWIFPTILDIVASVSWSCVDLCFCTPGHYAQGLFYCQSDVNRHCSRFVHPHRNDFLIVVVVIWCGEAISMIFMIITTLKKYMQTIRTNSEPISLTSVPHNSVPSAIANDAPSQEDSAQAHMPSIVENNAEIQIVGEVLHTAEQQNSANEKKLCCCNFLHINYNVKLLVIISCLFVVFTFPMMVIIIVDITSTEYVLDYYVIVSVFVLTLIYGTVSPLVLVYYMPSLRFVFKRTLFSCCSVTTISQGRASYSQS